MRKADKARDIAEILESLYPETPIPLMHDDVYTLLIAVVLSAQCTDKRVNEITPALFQLADNPKEMMQLDVEQIEEIIRPCGLSKQKSKSILGLSRMIVEDFDGKVPDSFEALESMPGVGHKTASVVMSQGFGYPAFPVDTHIHRLAYRWGLSTGKSVVQTEKDLKRLYPENSWNKLHLQIIFFGREYCKAQAHRAENCPICSIYGRKSLFKKDSRS